LEKEGNGEKIANQNKGEGKVEERKVEKIPTQILGRRHKEKVKSGHFIKLGVMGRD